MPQFIITNKKNGKQQTLSVNKNSIIIGRLETNEIPLAGKTVSRKHAEITRKVNDYLLVDLESGNGTFLNGKKLKPHEQRVLYNDDTFRIEEFEIRFLLESIGETSFPTEENTDSDIIEIKMIKKVLHAIDSEHHPNLEVISPPFEGQKAIFGDEMKELIIGRDSTCQLMLDTPTISRRHSVLHKKWGGVTLTDLGSKNGTLLNGEKIKEKLLKNGDIILCGAVKIIFRNPQEINLEDLSKEYEQEASGKSPNGEGEVISQEAKLSVEPATPVKREKPQEKIEKKPKEKIQEKPKERPKQAPPVPFFFSRFSLLEKLLLGIGVSVLVGTLITLFWVLS